MTKEELSELMDYSKETGIFIWKKSVRKGMSGKPAGTKNSAGYVRIKIHGRIYQAHRLAWLFVYGELPMMNIDHINHNRSDNRIENLRDVSRGENSKNQSIHTRNCSGVSGVSVDHETKKFRADITSNGIREYLGLFDSFDDAVRARRNAEKSLGFHGNHGN